MSRPEAKSFSDPDEVRDMPNFYYAAVELGRPRSDTASSTRAGAGPLT